MALTVLDAGVIVAALDAADAHHRASVDALRAVQGTGDQALVPASAYAECLVWPFRSGDVAVDRAEAFLEALPATIVPADRAIARTAALLRAEHGRALRLPDALIIATALETGAGLILTTDRGWPATKVPVHVIGGSGSAARPRACQRASQRRP